MTVFGVESKITAFLQPFGYVAYITNRPNFHRKLSSKARKCVFVGYAEDHTPDTFRFYNPKTDKVFLSRDDTK
jgi:hypothetical protein